MSHASGTFLFLLISVVSCTLVKRLFLGDIPSVVERKLEVAEASHSSPYCNIYMGVYHANSLNKKNAAKPYDQNLPSSEQGV